MGETRQGNIPFADLTALKYQKTRRKLPRDVVFGTKKRRGEADLTKLRHQLRKYPSDHLLTNNGYRYLLAEPDPHAPFRREFEESPEWKGKPIPGWFYRYVLPSSVSLALHDRAPQLVMSEDRMSVTGDKGYCAVRATHSVSKGSWYWEAAIEKMPQGSATRLGWGQNYADLKGPLGLDKFGYAWRSIKGTKFHESMGKKFSEGYGEGDVLGFMIVLPEDITTNRLPETFKDRYLVNSKGNYYFKEVDKVSDSLKKLKILNGSQILCFKNGEFVGVAFNEIYGGSYYPTLSLFRNATVSVNFGPHFKHPPSLLGFEYKGMCEKVEESVYEQTMADLVYFTENEDRLNLNSGILD